MGRRGARAIIIVEYSCIPVLYIGLIKLLAGSGGIPLSLSPCFRQSGDKPRSSEYSREHSRRVYNQVYNPNAPS